MDSTTVKRLLVSFLFVFLLPSVAFEITEDELQLAYKNAVADAEIAEPSEISDHLIAITEDNSQLVWRGEADHRQVLVTTWTSWDGYDTMVGKTIRMTQFLQAPKKDAQGNSLWNIYETTRDIWVTTVPEVQLFCQEHKPVDLTLRLEQVLGIPPHNGKTRFVEFWVNPNDLFRPTPDPSIVTHVSTLEFPPNVSEGHKTWFNDTNASMYGENGYPWTRLGYTYDWGNVDNHVGLSEFIIRIGAEIDVYSVTFTADYCKLNSAVTYWDLFE